MFRTESYMSSFMCLRRVLPAIILFWFLQSTSHAQIWTEDFDAEADGAVSGTAAGSIGGSWSVSTTPSGGAASFSKQTHLFGVEILQINQTVDEGVWQSNVVDISTMGEVALELSMYSAGASASDYVRAYYKLDGGPEVLFGELDGSALNFAFPASAIVSGATLQLVVRGNENTGGNIPFTSEPRAMGFENISIVDISTLYSRKDGTWDDNTAGNSTWSAIGLGGPSCDCLPTDDTHVVIGNGNTISIDGVADAIDVTIQSSGVLQWTTTADLDINRDGDITVETGGVLSMNGNAGAQIVFNNTNAHGIVVDGSLSIGNIDVNAAASVTFSGSGAFSVVTDLSINADDATIVNNKSGSALTIGNQMDFAGSNATFTNNGPLNLGTLLFDGDNSSFVNNANTVISGSVMVNNNTDDGNAVVNGSGASLSTVTIDGNNGDLVINNSGTIDQAGDFVDISNGCGFNNLSAGTWNWSFTPNTTYDVSVNSILDCSANGNTFNYNGSGAQRIIPVNYHNITLSNAGAKDPNNVSFSVAGNWLVSGTASFTPGSATVTLNGISGQTITNPGGESFNNLVVNNSSATSPQITANDGITVTGVLTMTDGNVNLDGNALTLSSSAGGALVHNLSATAGWLYNGSLTRSFPTTAITVGTVAGFFPLGGAANFRPFFVGKSNTASSSGTVTVSHTDASTATDISFSDGAATIQRRHDSFWSVSKTGITAGTFNITAGGTGFIIGLISDTRLTRSNDALGIGTAGASTGSPSDIRVHRTGLTSAQVVNSFYVASTDASNTPLPIELAYFRAALEGDRVITSWKTTQEKDNHFFTVQRTTDFESFYEVGRVDGKGDSKEENHYVYVDEAPVSGRAYYRLKQTDYDGSSTYSDPVMIWYDGLASVFLDAYPNPVTPDRRLALRIMGLSASASLPVIIYNSQGQIVLSTFMEEMESGELKKEITLPEHCGPGLYHIRAGRSQQLTSKVFLK